VDAAHIKAVAAVLEELADSHRIYVVTGGGQPAREYIKIARELGVNETVCDYIGIAATRLNAQLLISALRNAYPEPLTDYKEVAEATVKDGECIPVIGGVSPGYTTDAVAAILAEYVNAELLLSVTSVDGVYEADPRVHPEAKKYDRISVKELLSIVMQEELKAGSRIIIDPVAAKMIERSGIKTIVIDGGREPRAILDAVIGKHSGTEIFCER